MEHKIGFIGMGIMGGAMAANVVKAGFSVTVYNRTKEKTAPLAKGGAAVAETPRQVADRSDAVVLMLTGPEAVEAVLWGDTGLISGDLTGKPIVNMSTVSPMYAADLAKRLAERDIVYIDAPVSGSKKPAEDGTLVILAGGPPKEVRDLEPLFLKMGKKVIYCGETPSGSKMKMTVNLLLGIMMEGLCESVNFAEKCGLSTESILEMLLAGPLSCGLYALKADMLTQKDYPTQFPFKHMLKDLRFVLETADAVGAATPAGHSVFQLYRQGLGRGIGDEDFAAVKKMIEYLNA